MKEYFTKEQIDQEYHRIWLEEDDVLFFGEYLEGEGKNYCLTGKAVIEEETYHDFQIAFQLLQLPLSETIEGVMQCDWEWYDFVL